MSQILQLQLVFLTYKMTAYITIAIIFLLNSWLRSIFESPKKLKQTSLIAEC